MEGTALPSTEIYVDPMRSGSPQGWNIMRAERLWGRSLQRDHVREVINTLVIGAPSDHVDFVQHDSCHPGGKSGLAAELGKRIPSLEEGLLDGVLRRDRTSREVVRRPVKSRLATIYKARERLLISARRLPEKFCFIKCTGGSINDTHADPQTAGVRTTVVVIKFGRWVATTISESLSQQTTLATTFCNGTCTLCIHVQYASDRMLTQPRMDSNGGSQAGVEAQN